MKLRNLTPEERAVVEWQYGDLGPFRRALWNAIVLADDSNRKLLARAFPVEMAGYLLFRRQPGWWQKTKAKAQIYEVTQT